MRTRSLYATTFRQWIPNKPRCFVEKMADKCSGMWSDLKAANRLPVSSAFMASCESELQELMKQIDIMVMQKRREMERQNQSLIARLDIRDQELVMLKSTLDQKYKEIGSLKQHIEDIEVSQRNMVAEYEHQLQLVRKEVAHMKRDYEKMQKKHGKHLKDMERVKTKASSNLQENLVEASQLSKKLEDYHQKSCDWDLQKRTYMKQVETLEMQRKSLAEKCDFVQQQSLNYQTELDKRKQLLDSTELNYKNQVSHLEGQLVRSQDTIQTQEEQLSRIKASLDESMNCHRRALDEKEDIADELRKSRNTCRKLEDEILQLNIQIQAREDLLAIAETDQDKLSKDYKRLEKTLMEKDQIILNLEDFNKKETSDQIQFLKNELTAVKVENKTHLKAERQLDDKVHELQLKLEQTERECARLKEQLTSRLNEMQGKDTLQVQQLEIELKESQERLRQESESNYGRLQEKHEELMSLRSELQQCETELVMVRERCRNLQASSYERDETSNKRSAEVEVMNAQLDAVRLENHHLRQNLLRQAQTAVDVSQAEGHLRDFQSSYTASLNKLQKENDELRQALADVKARNAKAYETSKFTDAGSFPQRKSALYDSGAGVSQNSDRVQALQSRLDTTIDEYEGEVQRLKADKQQLQQELDAHKQSLRRLCRENLAISDFLQGVDVIVSAPNKNDISVNMKGKSTSRGETASQGTSSLKNMRNEQDHNSEVIKTDELDLSQGPIGGNNLSMDADLSFDNQEQLHRTDDSISAQFLAEEKERMKDLEKILDSHIDELKVNTQATIRKYIK